MKENHARANTVCVVPDNVFVAAATAASEYRISDTRVTDSKITKMKRYT